MRKICIFTSTRAEWGLQQGLAELIRDADNLQLQLLVSGSHLSAKLGMTMDEVEAAGFHIDERVDILKFGDSPIGICQTMGLALSGYGEALQRLSPDLLVILGDRYESFVSQPRLRFYGSLSRTFMVVKRLKGQWTNLSGTRLQRCLRSIFLLVKCIANE